MVKPIADSPDAKSQDANFPAQRKPPGTAGPAVDSAGIPAATPEPHAAVELRNVEKRFGQQTVLTDLSFRVAPGEHVFLIGPSGSGKSTALRLIMTLERPDAGSILINGNELHRMPHNGRMVAADERHLRTMRRNVGMVFQHFNLFSHMRVLRNVTEAPMRSLKLSRDQADARAKSLLARVGLADKLNAWPAQLSGGQKQRVAIARALAMQPDIMLFDEITSALDPEIAAEVLHVVRDLAGQMDMTMIFVTHQMRFARAMADRVLFFDQGRILEAGPPEQVLENPLQPRTRKFLATILDAS